MVAREMPPYSILWWFLIPLAMIYCQSACSYGTVDENGVP